MIIFEILFLVFIVGAEYTIYHYVAKEYDNIKKISKILNIFCSLLYL